MRTYTLAATQGGRFAQFLGNEFNRFGMLFYISQKRRATVEDFAAHLSVHPESLRAWMQESGRPSEAEVLRFPKEVINTARRILTGLD